MFIYINRVVWEATGLHAYGVFLQNDEILGGSATKTIDFHWQESTARECAVRWAKFYGCEIKAI